MPFFKKKKEKKKKNSASQATVWLKKVVTNPGCRVFNAFFNRMIGRELVKRGTVNWQI
jgi:hypothetical protein